MQHSPVKETHADGLKVKDFHCLIALPHAVSLIEDTHREGSELHFLQNDARISNFNTRRRCFNFCGGFHGPGQHPGSFHFCKMLRLVSDAQILKNDLYLFSFKIVQLVKASRRNDIFQTSVLSAEYQVSGLVIFLNKIASSHRKVFPANSDLHISYTGVFSFRKCIAFYTKGNVGERTVHDSLLYRDRNAAGRGADSLFSVFVFRVYGKPAGFCRRYFFLRRMVVLLQPF